MYLRVTVRTMPCRLIRLAILAALLVAGVSATASAQIYTWRDANGNQVLSDHKPSAPATSPVRTFRVEGNASAALLVTRPVARGYRDDYDDLVVKYAREQGLRSDLVRAVIQVESGYEPRAVSSKGALGLMQLMPGTAARLGVTRPFDPEENIKGGTKYLRQLLDQFDGNEELALAAYNAGPGAVNRYGNTVPPYRETRDYVRKVKTRTSVGTASGPAARPIYKTVEIVDGREVPHYSDTKPATGPYEVIGGPR